MWSQNLGHEKVLTTFWSYGQTFEFAQKLAAAYGGCTIDLSVTHDNR